MVNSLLLNAGLPNSLWGEAFKTACHVGNRIPIKKTHKSPYEFWYDRKPNLNYFRVWGCIAYYKITDPHKQKLGPKSRRSVFVGYAENSKSTMEAEFIALTAAGKEAERLRDLLLDIELWPQPMTAISLHYNSQSTMYKAYNNVYNGKSRHIGLRHAYIREFLTNGIITIVYIKSKVI
ncbi:hypothetical protein RND81_07G101300 [Saponaria officinalis]|uniref:Retroviral polymerase SH3-like domain-containing protein n=1 Tax=Saponaria officinalis TaxID=3572 RepID=A0AAW1JNR3_SAPOF